MACGCVCSGGHADHDIPITNHLCPSVFICGSEAFLSSKLRWSLAKRRTLVELVDVGADVGAFLLEEFVHGAVEGGMGEPVEGARGLGKEAARMLVLPLRAAF